MPKLDIGLLRTPDPKSDPESDRLYKDERKSNESHENERLLLENRILEARLHDIEQDREQRKQYSDRLFRLVIAWLATIGGIVLLHGFHSIPFELPTAVFATIVGSTTVSVVGLFVVVAKYLFPPGGQGASRFRQPVRGGYGARATSRV